MKNSVSQIKNAMGSLNNEPDETEEKHLICETDLLKYLIQTKIKNIFERMKIILKISGMVSKAT